MAKTKTKTVELSVQEGAARIISQCETALSYLSDLDVIHGRLDDDSSLDDALEAAEQMGDAAWDIRKLVVDIRKLAASIERWAADPATD